MLEQIEQLLNAPASGAEAPTLAHLEDTLTEGYAQALALEAERWRLERRLGEVARTVEAPAVPGFTHELSALAKRLASAEAELAELRGSLGTLYERVRSVRVAERA